MPRSSCRNNATSFLPHGVDDGYFHVFQKPNCHPPWLSTTIRGSTNVRAPEDLFYVLEVEIMCVPVRCAFVLVPLELCETGLLDESEPGRGFGTALSVYIRL
jgi:hypothetical protein